MRQQDPIAAALLDLLEGFLEFDPSRNRAILIAQKSDHHNRSVRLRPVVDLGVPQAARGGARLGGANGSDPR